MVNRKFISFAVAIAILCSQAANTVSVFAVNAEQSVYSCDFSEEGDIVGYRLYDSTNKEGSLTYDSQLQRLTASFGSSYGWNDKNGIKTDITKELEGCVAGDKIKAELDFTSTYWNDPVSKAKLFLEVVNSSGTKQIMLCEGPDAVTANGDSRALRGETTEYSYTEGDTVYLCITQCAGMHYYDNISVFMEKNQTDETTIVNDNFDSTAEGYTAYDESDTAAAVNVYDGILGINFTNSWSDANGIKKDISSLVKSGETYAASIDLNCYWGDSPYGAAELFFEIDGVNGEKRRIPIGEEKGEGENSATISGTAKLEFADGDKVYVCITQPSGYHKYDNLLIKTVSAEPIATPTVPSESDKPDDGTVLSDDFAESGNTAGYEVYDSANTGAEITAEGTLGVSFGEDPYSWNDKNGIKKDITDVVKSGSKYEVSADMYSSWWGGVSAKMFFEIKSGDTTTRVDIAEKVYESEGEGNVSLAGKADLIFNEGDKVYLCITQPSGYQTYDNIIVKNIGEAEPIATPTVPSESDKPDDGTVLSDDFAESGNTAGYEVYDSANTGAEITAEGTLGVSFGEDPYSWNDKNGIKKDITDVVKSGSKYEVSADMYSSWWGGVSAKMFFEIKSGDTTTRVDIAEKVYESEGEGNVSLAGKADLIFNEGDKVYLCITQPSGYQTYDNIIVKNIGEAEPIATPTVPSESDKPDDGTVLSDDFAESGNTAGYEVYDSANTGAEITAEGTLGVSFGEDPYSWNDKNGIKKDITDVVKSGSKYEVSADMYSSWWGGVSAKMFFEIKSGDTTTRVDIAEKVYESEGEGNVSLAGKADLIFNEGDKVYLCITQPSGYQTYDNIIVKNIGEAEPIATPTVPSESDKPDDGTVLSDDFAESGNTAGYEVYDSANTGAEITAEGTLGVSFGEDPYSWNDKNGIKKDITDVVKSGSKYEVSADMYSSWWGGVSAKMFFEIKSGDTTTRVDIAEKVYESEGEGNVSLAGKADLIFNEGDKVYLCITQPSGYQTYDNIHIVYAGVADTPPHGTDTPPTESASPEPIENAIFNDDFSTPEQSENYFIYDSKNTSSGVGISIDNGELVASMGSEGWNASNGIRRDITDLVKRYISGVTFGVQLDMSAFWGDNNDAKASVFFETVGEDGTSDIIEIGSMVPDNGTDKVSMRGSAQLSYSDGDRIYLCVNQMSGNHRYDNIAMWLENNNSEGVIPLTSGMRFMGNYFPASADAIFKNTFSGNAAAEMEKYTAYNDVMYVASEPRDGGAFFEFPEGGTSTRGVSVDITDAIDKNIPDGGQVRISCKMLPWWWWGSASIKLKIGDVISDVAAYTANTGDPGGVWAEFGGIIDLDHTPGEKVELIITMDSSTATGITIDDVCVELPYKDVTARDIAVSDVSKLADIDKVSIIYGNKFVTESDVDWGEPDYENNVVYGTTSVDGVVARAIITDSAVKVKVTPNGVSTEEIKLEYGKAITADADNEMVFLLDSTDRMNLISAVSGTGIYSEPESGTPQTTAKISVRDNGNGVTIEGVAAEAADNNKIIVIKNADGEIVKAVYVHLGSDGGYSAEAGILPTENYTAIMTDTGISTAFSYATADEFEELRNKINNGSAADLLEDDVNRMILGASSYEQLDKLSSSDKNKVYSQFESDLGSKTRAEAAELFDALVAISAAADDISETEWTQMLEISATTLGIRNLPIYEQYKAMDEDDRKSVKKKTYSNGASAVDEFADAFAGAVLNTRLMSAGQYSNVQKILKENADLFSGTDINGISVNEAKYIISHISDSDITIKAIADLIEEAEEKASDSISTGGGSGSGGSSGGSGGSGSSGSSGSSGGTGQQYRTECK